MNNYDRYPDNEDSERTKKSLQDLVYGLRRIAQTMSSVKAGRVTPDAIKQEEIDILLQAAEQTETMCLLKEELVEELTEVVESQIMQCIENFEKRFQELVSNIETAPFRDPM